MFGESILELKQSFKNLNINSNMDKDAEQIILWLKENYNISTQTTSTYRVILFRFYLWTKINYKSFRAINRRDIIEYIDFLKEPPTEWCGTFRPLENNNWKPFAQKKLSTKTLNYNIQVIQQVFKFLYDTAYLIKNPLARPVRRLSEIQNIVQERVLTAKECTIIYRYIHNLKTPTHKKLELKIRAIWIFNLLIYSACRRTEVTIANMDDFILKDDLLWLKVIGKGNKYGEIPVVYQLEKALNQYRQFYNLPLIRKKFNSEKHIPLIIKTVRKQEYLSIHSSLIGSQIRKICLDLAKEIEDSNYLMAKKLKHISAHWFRHTSATLQANSGMDLRTVQRNLRHSSIETTMKYQHIDKITQFNETSDKFKIQF